MKKLKLKNLETSQFGIDFLWEVFIFKWQIVIVKNIKYFNTSESDTAVCYHAVNYNNCIGSCLCDIREEVFHRSMVDKSFSLTSLSAHTEQKKYRVRSKAGNNQQQDTEKKQNIHNLSTFTAQCTFYL